MTPQRVIMNAILCHAMMPLQWISRTLAPASPCRYNGVSRDPLLDLSHCRPRRPPSPSSIITTSPATANLQYLFPVRPPTLSSLPIPLQWRHPRQPDGSPSIAIGRIPPSLSHCNDLGRDQLTTAQPSVLALSSLPISLQRRHHRQHLMASRLLPSAGSRPPSLIATTSAATSLQQPSHPFWRSLPSQSHYNVVTHDNRTAARLPPSGRIPPSLSHCNDLGRDQLTTAQPSVLALSSLPIPLQRRHPRQPYGIPTTVFTASPFPLQRSHPQSHVHPFPPPL
jgi:hypothetical protein